MYPPAPANFSADGSPATLTLRRQGWRWLLPLLLMLLFLAILLWLPWRMQKMETTERQEQLIADTLWVEQTIRFQLSRNEESIRLLANEIVAGYLPRKNLRERVVTLLRSNRELYRLSWLDDSGNVVASTDPSWQAGGAGRQATEESLAGSKKTPQYRLVPPNEERKQFLIDYQVPMYHNGQYLGSLVASYLPAAILEEFVPWWFAQDNEIALSDYEDKPLARRAAGGPGRGVYTHRRELDLPGQVLVLHTNSIKGTPTLMPNLLVGSIILLSLGLMGSLWALWRDINRRLAAEGALQRQVAFRSAMENSLVTGLRARDMEGRLIYVNPAFCRMVGYPAEELLGRLPPMPYWAPEAMEDYEQRMADLKSQTLSSQGFETIYQRANGERFPILVYEAPLLDGSGRQTGWMSSILDVSDLKKAEDINRQQSEKLQTSARLATMGELASMLAHELNQPLAAISSYMTGAINLLKNGSSAPERLTPVLEKVNVQAQRAGQIIRSVHEYVKKREAAREPVPIERVLQSAIPLIELQAHQYYVTIQMAIVPGLPRVLADRVMLEQVVLNLTRNAIESMQHTAPERRLLRIEARLDRSVLPPLVAVSISDQGVGIPADVAQRLFSPFFSTKAEGMGMGLNICRTTIEFHGGTLIHADNPAGGTVFTFTLPVHSED